MRARFACCGTMLLRGGAAAICARYTRFRADLPGICRRLHVKVSELQFTELRSRIVEWLAGHPLPCERRAA
jgi:hypothetical protein